jgi:hypothetical protein
MEHLFLWGAIAALAASWIYILVLRAKLRTCMSYIQNRIEKNNEGLESMPEDPEQNLEARDEGESLCT